MSKDTPASPRTPISSGLFALSALAFLIGQTGCSVIEVPASPFAHPASQLGEYRGLEGAQPIQGSDPQQVYQGVRQARAQNAIVLHVPGDEPAIRVLPLPTDGDRSVYVSNLLQETGVQKKLGSVQATLFRHSSDSINGIPMDCKMQKDGQAVRPESDYALQPGDRLRVVKAPSPAMKGLVNMILGI